MLGGAAGKVIWVGRATVFVVGLAMILALVFGAASTALGANGAPFLLGKQNFASQVSKFTKLGDGPALGLQVKDGHPPMNVNSSGKVRNLNADRLDVKSGADFYAAGSKVADADQDGKAEAAEHADSATNARNAANAATLDGKDASAFLGSGIVVLSDRALVSLPAGQQRSASVDCQTGEVAVSGGGGLETGSDQVIGRVVLNYSAATLTPSPPDTQATPTGWTVRVRNMTTHDVTAAIVDVFVLCAPAP